VRIRRSLLDSSPAFEIIGCRREPQSSLGGPVVNRAQVLRQARDADEWATSVAGKGRRRNLHVKRGDPLRPVRRVPIRLENPREAGVLFLQIDCQCSGRNCTVREVSAPRVFSLIFSNRKRGGIVTIRRGVVVLVNRLHPFFVFASTAQWSRVGLSGQ